MATVEKNGIRVEVPLGLPTDGEVKNGYQVFLQENTRQIEKHVEALTHLPKYVYPGWARVLHPFAGLGVTAQVLDAGCGRRLSHWMWERDPVCVDYLKEQGYEAKLVEDSYVEINRHDLHGYDMVIMDPTAGTIKTPGMMEFWSRAQAAQVPMVWVTDSACSKIWLHKPHYMEELGRRVEDAEDYLRAYNHMLNTKGYQIVEALREGTVTYFVAIRDLNLPPFKEIVRL